MIDQLIAVCESYSKQERYVLSGIIRLVLRSEGTVGVVIQNVETNSLFSEISLEWDVVEEGLLVIGLN